MQIKCEISLGELVDKITILMIKTERISDQNKKDHAQHELTTLKTQLDSLQLEGIEKHIMALKKVNEELWVIEDDIREKEAAQEFDEAFIALARAVYKTNDHRFQLKKDVNLSYGSKIVEVKSYKGI
jgi:hypothetical protein